jgi:hypothetical protein
MTRKTLVGMIHPGFPHADDVLRIQPLLRADLGEEQRLSGKGFEARAGLGKSVLSRIGPRSTPNVRH